MNKKMNERSIAVRRSRIYIFIGTRSFIIFRIRDLENNSGFFSIIKRREKKGRSNRRKCSLINFGLSQ